MHLDSLIRLMPSEIKDNVKARLKLLLSDNDLFVGPSSNYIAVPGKKPLEPPIPPTHLQIGYTDYLASGKRDVDSMFDILKKDGCSLSSIKRLLEFGCASGRMIRHIPSLIPNCEYWGVDICVDHIQWCQENLMPPINFALTTTVPHLPFSDGYFNFAYSGSVFTHIPYLATTWLLEIGRVLNPSGMLYMTVHDEHSVRILEEEFADHWLTKQLKADPSYIEHEGQFGALVIGSARHSQVFYHSEYLKSIIPPMFRCVSYNTRAYSYQSALLLQRI